MGDPAGIGPEVLLAALAPAAVQRGANGLIVGDAAWLRRTARRLGIPWRWPVVAAPQTDPRAPAWQVWDAVRVADSVRPGRLQAAAGRAALAVLDQALTLIRDGAVEALVTAPVSKAAISTISPGWWGHTEYLGHACGVADPVMMFVAGPLKVSLVTTHESLAQALRTITPARVTQVVTRTVKALTGDFGVRRPRVAVAAINPHAGERGLLGTDEQQWIAPLIRTLQRTLLAQLSGPWPADTLFAQAARGQYDAVVAMYHDQALIPIKLLAWESAVNVTLGLPFVRTSPSHGTAFDIAGRGRADPSSMRHAIRLAIALASRRLSK